MASQLKTEGTYIASVETPINGWFGEAGENQTPYIRIPCVIVDGDEEGLEIEWTGWLSDKAFESTVRTLVKAFEWDGDIASLVAGKVDPFTGKECEIVCENDTYNGKTRLKVQWLNNVNGGGGGAKKMDPNKLASFARMMSQQAKAIARAAYQEEIGGAPPVRQTVPQNKMTAPLRGAAPLPRNAAVRRPTVDPDLDPEGDDGEIPF